MPDAAVLDTNAVLDWLVFGDPRMQPLAEAITAGRVVWLATAPMRDELLHVLPRLARTRWRPDPAHVDRMHRALVTEWTEPHPPRCAALRCRDADDQKFVDLALAAEARWLVSHDRALLDLTRPAGRRGLSIVRPVDWVEDAPR
jgi:predicted nucleic acid-binding protein